MKRILVIDDSDAVRETIALLLEGEFAVAKKALGTQGLSLADVDQGVELVIIGIAPATVIRTSTMLNFAARGRFAILFLVDSKSFGKSISVQENVGWLVKPFNPYQLKAEVTRLLAPPVLNAPPEVRPGEVQNRRLTRYVEFPYVDRVAASLIHRFAATRLPVLISGEMGCGQPRIARAMHKLAENSGSLFVLTGREINENYLTERRSELAGYRHRGDRSGTLLIDEIDRLPAAGQSVLLTFIEEEAEKLDGCRIFTTSNADLLEMVYRGEFPEPLYYRLATLKLSLAPVRERREDIPAMARWFAQFYARELHLTDVDFSPAANERLGRYLWFGNLSEMETVIARTLAVHKKTRIEEADLIFEFDAGRSALGQPELETPIQLKTGDQEEPKATPVRNGLSYTPHNGSRFEDHAKSLPDLRVLIHELAHELKNPMVTIKTFAQLLTDRYQDESFRARFQDVVDGDIERIDDILEVMIEFADFSQPRKITLPFQEQVQAAIAEIGEESAQKQVRLGWKGNDNSATIIADEGQLRYVLKNALLAVLLQTKIGSEIEIGIAKPGCLTVSYLREGARVASITQVLGTAVPGADESVPPLRILLAKQLLERNGGRIRTDRMESDREMLEMEFPID